MEHNDLALLFLASFRNKLKSLRQENQLSQKVVAAKMGIPVSTYANWEQGRTEPNLYDLYRLIKLFDIDANELFEFHS